MHEKLALNLQYYIESKGSVPEPTVSSRGQGEHACLIHLQLPAYSQTLKDLAQLWEITTRKLVPSSHGMSVLTKHNQDVYTQR